MTLLILGLAVFFGIHLVPSARGLHAQFKARLGERGWKVFMAVIAVAGFVMIVAGWQRAALQSVYVPPESGHWAPRILMLPALILFAAAYLPSNIKRFTRHPMLWGTVIWAVAHLFANGDLRSLLLFGSFGAWALFEIGALNRRGAFVSEQKVGWRYELLVVIAGSAAYALLARFHGSLFGVTVIH